MNEKSHKLLGFARVSPVSNCGSDLGSAIFAGVRQLHLQDQVELHCIASMGVDLMKRMGQVGAS